MELNPSFPVLVLPGIDNSGPGHWQSLWERRNRNFSRVEQRDWNKPVCEEWAASLDAAVKQAGSSVVLVAHSLACLVVAHWAVMFCSPIAGAMLVAVPDPEGPNFPKEAEGFSRTPAVAFPFKSTVVVSANDPYGTVAHAEKLATQWGSRVVHIGSCGHINANSGLGEWEKGYEILMQLRG